MHFSISILHAICILFSIFYAFLYFPYIFCNLHIFRFETLVALNKTFSISSCPSSSRFVTPRWRHFSSSRPSSSSTSTHTREHFLPSVGPFSYSLPASPSTPYSSVLKPHRGPHFKKSTVKITPPNLRHT